MLPGGEERYADCVEAGAVEIGVRPEDVAVVAANNPGAIRGEVYVVEPTGNETLVEVLVGDEHVSVRAEKSFDAPIGSAVGIQFTARAACFFDASERCVVQREAGSAHVPALAPDSNTTTQEEKEEA
jgi:multiple sugar transport system ATP-binding protein